MRDYLWVVVSRDLQFDFSLYHALSLFLVEMVPRLEPASPTYVGDLLTLVESVLEDPEIILRRQADREKQRVLAELKIEGVRYEERMERLEQISHPKPQAEWLAVHFDAFARLHPWVGGAGHLAQVDRARDGRDLLLVRRLRASLPASSAARGCCCATSRSSIARSSRTCRTAPRPTR